MGPCQRNERWLYLHEDATRARVHALRDPLSIDPLSLAVLEDCLPPEHCDCFDEIDSAILANTKWRLLHRARWNKHNNILRTEGLALVWGGVRHKLRKASGFGKRHLFWTDNLPLALGIAKRRARSVQLAPILRSIRAFALASGCRIIARWIPSELNPADGASRLKDEENAHVDTINAPSQGDDGICNGRSPTLEEGEWTAGLLNCEEDNIQAGFQPDVPDDELSSCAGDGSFASCNTAFRFPRPTPSRPGRPEATSALCTDSCPGPGRE